MPTNLVYGDYLYNLRMNGNLTCFDALTGKVIYKERIPEARGITASGVASRGKLYYATEQGMCLWSGRAQNLRSFPEIPSMI
jgi:outer membrane protein assembly factor BamB